MTTIAMKKPILTLTMAEAKRLEAAGRNVHVYPRKKIVCVDGFKYFRLVK